MLTLVKSVYIYIGKTFQQFTTNQTEACPNLAQRKLEYQQLTHYNLLPSNFGQAFSCIYIHLWIDR